MLITHAHICVCVHACMEYTSTQMNRTANPADVILDILTKEKSQMAILRAYQSSGEPQAIQTAIKNAQVNESKAPTSSTS